MRRLDWPRGGAPASRPSRSRAGQVAQADGQARVGAGQGQEGDRDPIKTLRALGAVAALLQQRSDLAAHVPLSEVGGRDVMRLEQKAIIDRVKMTAYNAEEWLLERLAPHYSNSDDIQLLLRRFAELSGELRRTAQRMVVTLAPPRHPDLPAGPMGSLCRPEPAGSHLPWHRPSGHLPGRDAPFQARCLTLHAQWSGVGPSWPRQTSRASSVPSGMLALTWCVAGAEHFGSCHSIRAQIVASWDEDGATAVTGIPPARPSLRAPPKRPWIVLFYRPQSRAEFGPFGPRASLWIASAHLPRK